MIAYKTKAAPLSGTNYAEVVPQARFLLRTIAKQTKRRPYIRSAYFDKDKIFFTYLWDHLFQLPRYQRTRRLKYLPCAIELIRKSRQAPEIYQKHDRPGEIFYRFNGLASNGVFFAVQIKEDRRTGRKELMSVFPYQ